MAAVEEMLDYRRCAGRTELGCSDLFGSSPHLGRSNFAKPDPFFTENLPRLHFSAIFGMHAKTL